MRVKVAVPANKLMLVLPECVGKQAVQPTEMLGCREWLRKAIRATLV